MADEQEINRKRKSCHDFETPPSQSFSEIHENPPSPSHSEYNNELTKYDLTLTLLSPCHFKPRYQQPPLVVPLSPAPPSTNSLASSLSLRQPLPVFPPLPPPPPPSNSLQSSLSSPPPPPPPLPQSALQLSPSHPLCMTSRASLNGGPTRSTRTRRNSNQTPREGKSETINPLFPWATIYRAKVYSLNDLLSKKILMITGAVQCKRCERQFDIDYDLEEKFRSVGAFIAKNKHTMHDRAPSIWMNPELPACQFCQQENCVKPIIADKKKYINWLFLLLGQMLGCCTLEQLKYFCKHTKNHRTGAKDRVLYLTYLGLCKQLDPNGPFDR